MGSGSVRVEPATSPPARGGRCAKACLLTGLLGLGGTEKQVVLLAQGLQANGIDTAVLVMFEGGPYEEVLRGSGIPVVHFGFGRLRTGGRQLFGNLAAFWRLVSYLRRERPDVVHAFLFHCYVTGAAAARLARVPAFVAGRRSLGFFRDGHWIIPLVERVATRFTDLLVANAVAIADETRKHEGVPPDKVTVVYNGLPDAAFQPARPATIDTSLPVVLCVANLWSYKGHRYLLDALALVHDRGRSCTLVLAGDGAERRALAAQAAGLPIDVRFLGARTDIPALLARCDVVVLPSLTEGLSNAVMEAMAAGRPVIGTAVGGTPELLTGHGVVVPPADPVALADAIERLLGDPAAAARLSRRAQDWAGENLSAPGMIRAHIRIYDDLLDRRCAR